MNGNDFAQGRNQAQNVKAVLDDIIGHGNDSCLLPGQIEAKSAERSEKNDGLLFTSAEIAEFNEIGAECGLDAWDESSFKVAQ